MMINSMSTRLKVKNFLLTGIGLILFLAFAVQMASAISIVVDGTRESAWDGSGGQAPGSYPDPDEGLISDSYDIKTIEWTNNPTQMYFLVETFASTIWNGTPFPTVVICLDTDANLATPATGGAYANCNSMTGIDRSIVATRFGVEVYAGDPNTGTYLGAGTLGRSGAINELSVPLALLGMDSASTCTETMVGAVYFDNGIGDPDDTTPGSGTMNFSCGSPTAVTTQSMSASAPTGAAGMLWFSGAMLALASGFVLLRKRDTLA